MSYGGSSSDPATTSESSASPFSGPASAAPRRRARDGREYNPPEALPLPMPKSARPVPDGYHTATPGLVVRGAAKAIEFYRRALGATETARMLGPDGRSILHAELKVGDSLLFVADEDPKMGLKSPVTLGGTTQSVHLFVPDTDAAFRRAVEAGAKPIMPPVDMYWGDRYARFIDPFGHEWGIATHLEDLSPEEIRRRSEEFFRRMAEGRPPAPPP
jgi:PhnB protein